MSEPRAAYVCKGKEVMVESKKGIVEKTYPTGMAKVRLADSIWIGSLEKLSECDDGHQLFVIDRPDFAPGLGFAPKSGTLPPVRE